MATDLKKFAEQLVGLTVLEVNELSTILKDEYGIEPAAAAVAVAAVGGGDAAPAEAPREGIHVRNFENDDFRFQIKQFRAPLARCVRRPCGPRQEHSHRAYFLRHEVAA